MIFLVKLVHFVLTFTR